MRTTFLFLIFFGFIALCFFSACKEKVRTESALQTDTHHLPKQMITIDTFSTSPETDSCSCLFSADSLSYHQQNYIFAYNLSTIAYMKINGVMTKFAQTEFGEAGNNSLTTFKSDPYEMILELKDVKENGKKTILQWGSIRVMDKSGNAAITPFYGGCGCKIQHL